MVQHRISFYSYRTPIGPITLAADDAGLTHAAFGTTIRALPSDAVFKASAITNQAANEILEYLAGKRIRFDAPLNPEGSEFACQVWAELRKVPYGSTTTSANIARQLGIPEAYRSVGAAIRRNPLPLFIPHHRVVNSEGKAPGVGEDARRRSMLLAFEQTQAGKR